MYKFIAHTFYKLFFALKNLLIKSLKSSNFLVKIIFYNRNMLANDFE